MSVFLIGKAGKGAEQLMLIGWVRRKSGSWGDESTGDLRLAGKLGRNTYLNEATQSTGASARHRRGRIDDWKFGDAKSARMWG